MALSRVRPVDAVVSGGGEWRKELRAAICPVLVLVAGCAGPSRSPIEAPWQTVALGLCEDYPEETRSIANARADLAAAHDAGATVLRIAFGWDAIEPERGKYDWSFWDEFVRAATEEFGLRLIPYVCYTPKWAARDAGENFWRSPPRDPADFGRFMTAIVHRYHGAIHSWELWNEPDNRAYWLGSVDEFAALVRAGSAAVRGADPSARVVLGGIATELSFLETLLREQHLAPAIDVVNLHNYFETWHPDAIERLPDYLARAAQIVRAYGEGELLWLAEAGYSSVGPRVKVSEVYQARWPDEHTEQAQAAALARLVLLGLGTQRLSVIAWYRINDLATTQEVIGDDNNRHLGVRRANGDAKPALAEFAQLAHLFATPFRVVDARVTTVERTGSEPVVRVFALRDGRQVIAAWMSATGSIAATSGSDPRHATINVQLPAAGRWHALTNPSGGTTTEPRAMLHGRELQIELRGGGVLLGVTEP